MEIYFIRNLPLLWGQDYRINLDSREQTLTTLPFDFPTREDCEVKLECIVLNSPKGEDCEGRYNSQKHINYSLKGQYSSTKIFPVHTLKQGY